MMPKPVEPYAEPGELAEDLEHWLADEPVNAYREPWGARGRRFLKRHQTAMMGTIVVAGMALIGRVVLTTAISDSNWRTRTGRSMPKTPKSSSRSKRSTPTPPRSIRAILARLG
jgi:hypothetical protein